MARAGGGRASETAEDAVAVQSNGSVRHDISRAVRYRARNCSLAKERHVSHNHLAGSRQRAGSAPAVSGPIAALNRKKAQRDEIKKDLPPVLGVAPGKLFPGPFTPVPSPH